MVFPGMRGRSNCVLLASGMRMRYELKFQINIYDITINDNNGIYKDTDETKIRMKSNQKTKDKVASSSSCDLNIFVEDKQYGAHWSILRKKSKFFEEFYLRKTRRKKLIDGTGKTCVHLRGVSSKQVGLFLQYVYTNSSKNDEHFQLNLNDINDFLKFSVMFGLKDLEMGKTTNVVEQLGSSLIKAQPMSELHRNLLQFLYVRTSVYKTSDIAKFVAHKAYIAANMECLLEVLNIVSCNTKKMTMRIRLLDILITLFTASLDQQVIETDIKGHEEIVKDFKPEKYKDFNIQNTGKMNDGLFLKPGLIIKTANPKRNGPKPKRSSKQQENEIDRKISSNQNSKKLNESKTTEGRNVNSNKISKRNERQKKSNEDNFVIDGKARPKQEPSKQLCSRSVSDRRKRLPSNKQIALIKEHLERINEHFECVTAQRKHAYGENAKSFIPQIQSATRDHGQTKHVGNKFARVDRPETRVEKQAVRVGRNECRGDKRAISSQEHVFGHNGHVIFDDEHSLDDGRHVLNGTEHVLYDKEHDMQSDKQKEVAHDTNMMREVNEMVKDVNEVDNRMPESSYGSATVTRKVRKMWMKDFQTNFSIIQSQDDKLNLDQNPQNTCNEGIAKKYSEIEEQPLKCEEIVRQRIYLTGGIQKDDYFAHKAILEVNLATGTYTTRESMCTGRYNHGIAQLRDEIYLVGGNSGFFEQLRSVESYSPEYERWTMKPSMHEARDEFSLAVCDDGSLYAIGGHNGIQDLRSVERFDARENVWKFVSPMRNYRAGACAVAVNNRSIYAIGGFNGQTYLTSVEQYDVTADVWVEVQPISTKRAYSCSVLFERSIYVFGGFDGQSALSSCEMYDIKAGTWEILSDMHTPRMNATAVAYTGGLFVFGGECDSVFLETVECYNMKKNTWSFVHRLPQPMAGMRACVYQDGYEDETVDETGTKK